MISNIWYVGSAVVCCSQNEILDYRSSTVLNQKRSYANSHQVRGKCLESFFDLHDGWNFLGYKFLTIAVSFIMEIELGIQRLQKAFLLKSHNWQMVKKIICLFKLKDHIVFSTELAEAFCGVGKVAQISGYFPFVKTHFHSPQHSLVKGK